MVHYHHEELYHLAFGLSPVAGRLLRGRKTIHLRYQVRDTQPRSERYVQAVNQKPSVAQLLRSAARYP